MHNTLKAIYQALPLSANWRKRIKAGLPYSWVQENPFLRRFGTVQELYPWRRDGGLDTRFYIQNFFSVFYPTLDTATQVRVWCYDASGRLIAEQAGRLDARQTLEISMKRWLSEAGSAAGQGTLFWHIVIPPAVAVLPECARDHGYFTDRGYMAFVKDGVQVSFMHGIDRYAVFQESENGRFDYYYGPGQRYVWLPEIPLGPALACTHMDVMTVNRTEKEAEMKLEALDAGKAVVASYQERIPARGLFCHSLEGKLLNSLADQGRLRLSGIPSRWGRAMVLRHFSSGAVSAMHC